MEFFKFDYANIWDWVELGRWILAIAVSILSICLAIKKRKIKFCDLLDSIFSWIEEAETHDKLTGEEKLDWVLNKCFKYCVSNHISYKEEDITEEIERIISLSKSVNNAYHDPVVKKLNPAITGEEINKGE